MMLFFKTNWENHVNAIKKARNAYFADSSNSSSPELLLAEWVNAVSIAEQYMSEKTLREGSLSPKTVSRYSIFAKERSDISREQKSISQSNLSPSKLFGSFIGRPDIRFSQVSTRLSL